MEPTLKRASLNSAQKHVLLSTLPEKQDSTRIVRFALLLHWKGVSRQDFDEWVRAVLPHLSDPGSSSLINKALYGPMLQNYGNDIDRERDADNRYGNF